MRKRTAIDPWGVLDPRDDAQLALLAADLACSVGEVRGAVQRVGPSVADVRNYIIRSRALTVQWEAARPRTLQQK